MTASLCFVHDIHTDPAQLRTLRDRHGLAPSDLAAIEAAALHDHALGFESLPGTQAGVLLARYHLGSLVHGVLLQCSERGRRVLELAIGTQVPSGPTPHKVVVHAAAGGVHQATAWLSASGNPGPLRAPSPQTLHALREGLRHWRLPTRGLDNAAVGLPGVDRVSSVFVYGTLLRGESRSAVWQRHTIRCAVLAVASGRLYTTDDDYPAAIASRDARDVHGDFIRVAGIERLLQELDEIEEYRPGVLSGQLFRRVLTEVRAAGKVRRAWMYVAGDALTVRAPIESGSWRQHLGTDGPFRSTGAS